MKQPKTPTEVDVHVGQMIRHLRAVHKITQEQLAERLGLTFQQIQKYEKGTNRVSASRIYGICEVFNVTPNDLFAGLAISGREGQPADPTLLQDRRSVEVIRRFNELPEKAKNSVSQLIFSMRNILVEGSPR
jgi:transcriptional regulator with XRE-family HTH domain